MNENTCVVVQCWEGDAEQVEQLLPFWQHHQVPIYLQSPDDSRVESRWQGVEALHAGQRGWSGHHTIDRQILHFEQMLSLPFDWFFYTDADAVCLSAQFPKDVYSGEFWSNILSTYDFWTKVYEYQEDDRDGERELQVKEACRYLGAIDNGTLDVAKWHQRCPVVMQPPYFVPRAILEKFVSTAKTDVWRDPLDPPEDFPIPFIDWFYPALCRHGGIPGHGFAFDGVSMPTWHRHWMERARNQIQSGGGRWVHSVKTVEAAQVLYDKWQERRREDEDQTFRFELGGPTDDSVIGAINEVPNQQYVVDGGGVYG